MALPVPSSSLGRTDTGMPAVSDLSGRLSRSSRKRRSEPPHMRQHHVVERAAGGVGQRAQPRHRELLRGEAPLLAHAAVQHRQRRVEGHRQALAALADAAEDLAEGRDQLRRRLAAGRAAPAPPRPSRWPSSARRRARSACAGAPSAGRPEGRQRPGSSPGRWTSPRCSMRMPLMPSISEWCILTNSAKRSRSSPSMIVHSQGGRLRSSGVLCSRPTSSPSSRSPPGQGSARVAHVVLEVDVVVLDPLGHRVQVEGVLAAAGSTAR